MFENLEMFLREENARRTAEKVFYIENGYFTTWAEVNRTNPDAGLKAYSTAAKWEAYQSGAITREKAIVYAVKRMEREQQKALAKELARLEVVAAAPVLKWCTIHVYWKRSATWGYNPTAEAFSNAGNTFGHASGCGYDKCSTAVAKALNANPAALRALYTVAEKALAEGKAPTRHEYNTNCISWRDVLGYGSGYSVLPYFEGGVGVSCFASIFEECGYRWSSNRSAKHYDYFNIELED